MTKIDKYQIAIEYMKMGINMIPVKKDKKPAIKSWIKYQTERNTIEELKSWFDIQDFNIAIVTGVISGLCVIDIDTEEGLKNIKEFIPDNLDIPKARTPRGGYHWYFALEDKDFRNNAGLIKDCDFRGNGGYIVAPPSMLDYVDDKKGHIKGSYRWTSIIDKKRLINILSFSSYCARVGAIGLEGGFVVNSSHSVDNTRQPSSTVVMGNYFGDGQRDNHLFHLANCLVKGNAEPDFILSVMQRVSSLCNPPFPADEVELKVKSAIDRANRKERNITQEIRDYIMSSHGVIMSSDVVNCLQLSSREDRKNLSKALSRLVDEGILQKEKKKNGCFRKPENTLEEIDFFNADESLFKVWLPLGLHQLAGVQKKNIILVAGVSNMGKTAFLLDIAKNNMHMNKVRYFSSEMGGSEAKIRLKKTGIALEEWKNVKFYERSDNFEDVIFPDDINIIDYLEENSESYLVSERIKQIWNRLENGIAIIAIQKNPGAAHARGGWGTYDKPRLYVTLDNNKCKVTKAKNILNMTKNPNNLSIKYRFDVNGSIIPDLESHYCNDDGIACIYTTGINMNPFERQIKLEQ